MYMALIFSMCNFHVRFIVFLHIFLSVSVPLATLYCVNRNIYVGICSDLTDICN